MHIQQKKTTNKMKTPDNECGGRHAVANGGHGSSLQFRNVYYD